MPGSGWLGFGGVESACFVFRVCFGVSRTAFWLFRFGGAFGSFRAGVAASVAFVGVDAGCRVGLGFFGLVSPWQFSCSRVRHDSS